MTTTINTIPTDRNCFVVAIPRALEEGRDIKNATERYWKVTDTERLEECELVLATVRGVVIAVYELRGYFKLEDFQETQYFTILDDLRERVQLVLDEAPRSLSMDYIGRSTGVPNLQSYMFWDEVRNYVEAA